MKSRDGVPGVSRGFTKLTLPDVLMHIGAESTLCNLRRRHFAVCAGECQFYCWLIGFQLANEREVSIFSLVTHMRGPLLIGQTGVERSRDHFAIIDHDI